MSYRLLCRMLRAMLVEWVASGAVGSVACRATAALYALLLAHPVDRRGRCASCGWAGVVFGRRRRCRIYRVAQYWLHQSSTTSLLSRLVSELGLSVPPPPAPAPERPCLTITGRSEPDDTDVLPAVEAAPTGSPGPNIELPALPSSPLVPSGDPRTGWPDPDHGGSGEHPDRPRPRRGPPERDRQVHTLSVPEFPVIAVPLGASVACDGRVPGAAGPGSVPPVLLVPPRPVDVYRSVSAHWSATR